MERKVVSGIMLLTLLMGMLMLAFNMCARTGATMPTIIHLDAEPPVLIDLTNPVYTKWHELYPTYCNLYNLSGWKDSNTNSVLDKCDYVFLRNESTGKRGRYHVENVTVTLNVTLKPENVTWMMIEFEGDIQTFPWGAPVCTKWHEVYPVYCNRYHLIGWEDRDNSGNLNVLDQILMNTTQWYRVDEVKTDIIVKLEPWKPEDIYADGEIDIFDLVLISIAFGSKPGDPNWNADADVWPKPVGDNLIDIFDLVSVATHFGEKDC